MCIIGPISLEAERKKCESIIHLSLIGSGTFTLIYVLIGSSVLLPQPDPFCRIYAKLENVIFAFAFLLNYFALWYKVNQGFYQHPIMKLTLRKTVLILNKMIMPTTVLVALAIVITCLLNEGKVYAGCGCKFASSNALHRGGGLIGIILATSAFQSLVMFFFLYPLYLHHRNLIANEINPENIIPVIKRAAKAAGICILSDACMSILVAIYLNQTQLVISLIGETVYVHYFMYILNLLVNFSAAIASFSNWRERIFPFGNY